MFAIYETVIQVPHFNHRYVMSTHATLVEERVNAVAVDARAAYPGYEVVAAIARYEVGEDYIVQILLMEEMSNGR